MSAAPITPQFQDKAPAIMAELIEALAEYELSAEDAAAILGNFGTETAGFTMRQEVGKPNKDTTGYGWAQWTGMDEGERRLLFEEWCLDHDYDDVVEEPDDSPEDRYDDACMGYFIHEITETWEKRVLTDGGTISGVYYPALGDCETLADKTISFMKLFERPGTPHEEWRIEMAEEALRLYRGDEPAKETTMPYASVVLSSGHGLYVRGASGILDEVDEARKVVEAVADELRARGVEVTVFHDDKSKSQNENLNAIVNFHNKQSRDLDISVHFNAYVETTSPMGTEVLYFTNDSLASQVSAAIAKAGKFINRGAKKRTDLFFLNSTEEPAILLEICFVDSTADANLYRQEFTSICNAIATVLGGEEEERPALPEGHTLVRATIEIELNAEGQPVKFDVIEREQVSP